MPISSEFMETLSVIHKARCRLLMMEEETLVRALWSNHREQDAVIAELSLLRGETPVQVRCAMAQPPCQGSIGSSHADS